MRLLKSNHGNRTHSVFNILNSNNLNLLKVISNSKYLINGFSNKLIRKKLFDNTESEYIINKTTRLLSKLKAHDLIKKVARKNKYYLTTKGHNKLNSILLFTNKNLLS